MARMIDQLLDFTRIHLGQGIPIEREEVDLSEICRVVIDELEAAQGCSIRFEHAGDLVGFWDRDRLSQLLSTLGGNACQHRRAATPVLVRADGTQARMVVLEVWNEGATPENILPVVFDPHASGYEQKPRERPTWTGALCQPADRGRARRNDSRRVV